MGKKHTGRPSSGATPILGSRRARVRDRRALLASPELAPGPWPDIAPAGLTKPGARPASHR